MYAIFIFLEITSALFMQLFCKYQFINEIKVRHSIQALAGHDRNYFPKVSKVFSLLIEQHQNIFRTYHCTDFCLLGPNWIKTVLFGFWRLISLFNRVLKNGNKNRHVGMCLHLDLLFLKMLEMKRWVQKSQ